MGSEHPLSASSHRLHPLEDDKIGLLSGTQQ